MFIYKKSLKQEIKEKIVILRDFGIVDRRNEAEYETKMKKAVESSNEPSDVVLDRITVDWIRKHLDNK